jgi:hypothetical protein
VVKRGPQLGPVALRAGRLLDVDPAAAGGVQGVELEGGVLLAGGDPGVPDQHGVATSRNPSRHAIGERVVSRGSYGRRAMRGTGLSSSGSAGLSQTRVFGIFKA